jgi:hypothetical protein
MSWRAFRVAGLHRAGNPLHLVTKALKVSHILSYHGSVAVA